jgi:hypothetical protein
MYWQYTTAFAVSVVDAIIPMVSRNNIAVAILRFIGFSSARQEALAWQFRKPSLLSPGIERVIRREGLRHSPSYSRTAICFRP